MNDNFLAKIILGLLSIFLLVDSLNGFLVMSFGLDIKLSVIYKSIVLMLVALYLVRFNIGSIIRIHIHINSLVAYALTFQFAVIPHSK